MITLAQLEALRFYAYMADTAPPEAHVVAELEKLGLVTSSMHGPEKITLTVGGLMELLAAREREKRGEPAHSHD